MQQDVRLRLVCRFVYLDRQALLTSHEVLDEVEQQLMVNNQRRIRNVSILRCSRHTSKADESSAEEANSQCIQVQLYHPVPESVAAQGWRGVRQPRNHIWRPSTEILRFSQIGGQTETNCRRLSRSRHRYQGQSKGEHLAESPCLHI